jgi:hypothetical protein
MRDPGLWAGTARVDITPIGPISMGGFGQRFGTVSQGVNDHLFAKALLLSDGTNKLLIITTDLISIPNAVYRKVIQKITKSCPLTETQICLTASHTHSGPDVDQSIIIASPTKAYLSKLVDNLVEVGLKAIDTTQKVKVYFTTSQADFLVNRRQFDKQAIVDDRILVCEVVPVESYTPLAILFGVGCHPVCLGHGNLLISADYPGFAQRMLEKELAVENALFVNLAEGNVIPSTRPLTNSLDTRGYIGGSFDDARQVGESLARAVIHCLDDAHKQSIHSFRVAKSVIHVNPSNHDLNLLATYKKMGQSRNIILEYLPSFSRANLFNLAPVMRLWRDASDVVVARDMSEEEMQRLMAAVSTFLIMVMRLLNPGFRKKQPLRIQTLKFEHFHIVTLPGEVLNEVAREWQFKNRPYQSQAFVIGLANGFLGYLPHPSNFEEQDAEFKYETIMNALEPAATVKALDEALAQIISMK